MGQRTLLLKRLKLKLEMVGRDSDKELVTFERPVAIPDTFRPEVMGPSKPDVIGPRRPDVIGPRSPPKSPPFDDVEFPPAVALILLGVKVKAAEAFHVGAGAEVVFANGARPRTVSRVVWLRISRTWNRCARVGTKKEIVRKIVAIKGGYIVLCG